jgi:hypothetical protein
MRKGPTKLTAGKSGAKAIPQDCHRQGHWCNGVSKSHVVVPELLVHKSTKLNEMIVTTQSILTRTEKSTLKTETSGKKYTCM